MKRKLMAIFFVLTLSFNMLGQTITAYNDKLVKLSSSDINNCVKNVALEWAETIKPGNNFSVSDVKEIEVIDSKIPEYTVSYFSNAQPYGYAVIVFKNNEPVIKESNINPGQEGIYSDLVDNVIDVTDTSRKNLNIDKKIIELSPMQYGIVANKRSEKIKKIYDNFGNEINSDELMCASTQYARSDSIYIKDLQGSSKYKVSEKLILNKYTKKPLLYTESKIEQTTKKYCCATQASLQIAYMEGLFKNTDKDIKSTYNKLWSYAEVTETSDSKKNKSKNKVTYGETTTYKAKKAIEKLAEDKGYKVTTNWLTKSNPSVSWIKDNLKNNKPILMGYGLNVNGKIKGHEISVLGLIKAKKVSSGNTYNYIMVYDSWNDSPRYINYTLVDFDFCEAAYFYIRK